MGTKHGKYSTDSLGTHGGSPLKVTEMDRERTRPKSCADGVSWADILDKNSNEESNFGMASSIKRKR